MLKVKEFLERQFEVLETRNGNPNKIRIVKRIKDNKVFNYFDFLVDKRDVLKGANNGKDIEIEILISIEGFEEDGIHVKISGCVDVIGGEWRLDWKEDTVEINEIEKAVESMEKTLIDNCKDRKFDIDAWEKDEELTVAEYEKQLKESKNR